MALKRIGVKKRVSTTDFSKLNSTQTYFLKNNICLSGRENELGFAVDDVMTIRRMWVRFGKSIMDEWMQDTRNAGRRPFGWYFDRGLNKHDIVGYDKNYKRESDYLRAINELQPWEVDALKTRPYPG